jgi:hypothetical protein
MGLKSRRAFSTASQDQELAAAKAFQSLLQHVDKPINMSLLRIPHLSASAISQYGIVQFNDKEKAFATAPSSVEQAFGSFSFTDAESLELKSRLLLDMNLALAIELSRVTGHALYVVHSDSYCSSGYISFEAARATEGVIYGWEGREFLLEFGPDGTQSCPLSVEQTQFWKYASLGVNRHLGVGTAYGDYLEEFDYSSEAIARYRLMIQKALVQELQPEAF